MGFLRIAAPQKAKSIRRLVRNTAKTLATHLNPKDMPVNRFSSALSLQSRLSFRRDAHTSSVEHDKGALQPSRGRTAQRRTALARDGLTGQFKLVQVCQLFATSVSHRYPLSSTALHPTAALRDPCQNAGRLDLWTIQTSAQSQRQGLNCPLAIHSQHADLSLQQGTQPAAPTWRVPALPSSRRVIGGIPSRLRIARRSGWSTSSMTTLSPPSCGAQAACLPALRPCGSRMHPAHARCSAAGRRHAAGLRHWLIRLTLHGKPETC